MRKRRQERASLVTQVRALAGTRSQAEICVALGITRAILREIAEINFIDIDSRKRARKNDIPGTEHGSAQQDRVSPNR